MDKFVSRGGIKLQAAIENWSASGRIKIEGTTVLDVGSSTGGFVDCLLQNGAAKVYSVDTAYGELAWKLRNDPRVVVMERTNILHFDHLPDHTPGESKPTPGVEETKENTSDGGRMDSSEVEKVEDPERAKRVERVDLITIDAGWTKLELVLPVVKKFLKPGGIIIALLKPHYEANKRDLVKGVLPVELAEQVKDQIVDRLQVLGYRVKEVMDSPILGGAGNTEYLLLLKLKDRDGV